MGDSGLAMGADYDAVRARKVWPGFLVSLSLFMTLCTE